jgi:hypothetical protein
VNVKNIFNRTKEKLENYLRAKVAGYCLLVVVEIIRTGKYPGNVYGDDKLIDDLISHATLSIMSDHLDNGTPDEIDLAREYQLHPSVIEFFNLYQLADPLDDLDKRVDWGIFGCLGKWWYARDKYYSLKRNNAALKDDAVDITSEGLGRIVALITASMVVGGFFYQQIFFGSLGVNVTKYLSVSDYLAASLGVIAVTVIAVGINIVLFAVHLTLNAHARSRTRQKFLMGGVLVGGRLAFLISILSLIITLGTVYSKGWEAAFAFIPGLSWLISLCVVPGLCLRFFKRPMFPIFAVMYVIYFSVNIFLSARESALDVESGKYFSGKFNDVEIEGALPSSVNGKKLRPLEATSNFFILYDIERKRVLMVPRERVALVTASQ